MKNRTIAFLLALASVVLPIGATAQELPPLELYKQMLEMNKDSGWVAFRNYDGQQWIYFTPLVTLHCRLAEVRYSLNSDALDQEFALPRCNPSMPFSLPAEAGVEAIALTLPAGTVDTLSVQVRFEGEKRFSDILTYRPCKNAGEASCAEPVE